MPTIKVMLSFPPNLLEALDKLALLQERNRSQQVCEILRENPDIYEILEGLQEANKAVSNE